MTVNWGALICERVAMPVRREANLNWHRSEVQPSAGKQRFSLTYRSRTRNGTNLCGRGQMIEKKFTRMRLAPISVGGRLRRNILPHELA
jgi:hypothetical protein